MAERELLILRHAKSAWNTEARTDLERPLAKRGKRDCPRVGGWLEEQGLVPDVIVSSPAKRARQTARRTATAMGFPKDAVSYDERLYEAGVGDLLTVLADCPSDARRAMIVGHNPGLEALVVFLAGGAIPEPADDKLLPTATVAHFRMPDDWSGVASGAGRLVTIMRPRWIEDG